jgi:sortase B
MDKSGRKRIRRLLAGLLAAVFFACAFLIARLIREDARSRRLYEDAVLQFVNTVENPAQPTAGPAQETAPPVPPETGETSAPAAAPMIPKREFPAMQIDFDKLLDVNEDIVGWLWVPDTDINYPIVQGESNYSYLERDYTGKRSNAGSIFMDSRNSPDFSDPNTIVYGHNMRSGRMFGALKEFKEQEYVDEHSLFCIVTPEGQFNYDIVAVDVVDMYSDLYYTTFNREGSFDQYLKELLDNSLIRTKVRVTEGDRLCTLSTCTSAYWRDRLIVVGRLWTD